MLWRSASPNRNQPAEFRAKATYLLPTTVPDDVELALTRAGEPERHYPMKLVDGIYKAQAVPFPGLKGPLVFRLEVKYADGAVSGVIEDQDFKFNQQPMKLSQVEQILDRKTWPRHRLLVLPAVVWWLKLW